MSLTHERLLLTRDLPGSGGAPVEREDFVVEEIPAYAPSGEGDHCFAWIEKQGLTTPQAVEILAQAVGTSPNDVGAAGLKDKHAITRQWLSFERVPPERLLAVTHPNLRVLQAAPHGHKLRTGHLQGNRFVIRLRNVQPDGLTHAEAVLSLLARVGLPNYFGPQRFGIEGRNVERGLAMLQKKAALPHHPGQRRLMISALQSHLFNLVLAERVAAGTLRTILGGEVMIRTDSGGPYISDDTAEDQTRLDDNGVVISGPIPGPRMLRPREGSPARELEDRVFIAQGIAPDDFAVFKRLARGTRRPLVVPITDATVEPDPDGILLRFTLPAGSYATVLLAEVTKAALS